jgi:SAM-dependent methyltransferase
MFKRTVSAEDLARLKQRSDEASAAYTHAILELEKGIQQFDGVPSPPPPYDEHQLPALNERWDILSQPDFTGWRRGIGWLVQKTVGGLFDRQRAFNSAVVDHLNRNVAGQQGLRESATDIVGELAKIIHVQSKLILFAQALSPFIDTRDREVSGLMRRINEDVAVVNAGLAGTVTGVADELRKRWETTLARERRLEGQMDDLRATSAVAHQVAQTLKREIGRVAAAPDSSTASESTSSSSSSTSSDPVDSYKYVGFEDLFRGSQDDIRTRLESYLPYFEGAADVLDVGCGRGEFLELLRDHGIGARGIDINHEMVEQCRARGLTVDEADLRSHLTALPDGSLGGLFAAQVVEHLEPAYLLEVLDVAYHRLRPGSTVILETINVASWSAFFQSYIRDITHVRPLHPDTLRYLVTASGFQRVEVVYRSPSPAQDRLEALTGFVPDPEKPGGLNDLVVAFNENVEKLNRLMFSDQDYAVIGRRM